ncbi:hypothetical protein HGM15179_019099, partial [Zosterops borbonicus]
MPRLWCSRVRLRGGQEELGAGLESETKHLPDLQNDPGFLFHGISPPQIVFKLNESSTRIDDKFCKPGDPTKLLLLLVPAKVKKYKLDAAITCEYRVSDASHATGRSDSPYWAEETVPCAQFGSCHSRCLAEPSGPLKRQGLSCTLDQQQDQGEEQEQDLHGWWFSWVITGLQRGHQGNGDMQDH